jgi:hypothetical protein
MIQSLFTREKYTAEELNARLKFFIGVILGLTLFGIVFVVLYSLIFVTQPMNGMSPVDNKFFELIIPIATFLTGTLSGIMLAGDDKEAKMKALEAATKAPPPSSPTPSLNIQSPKPFSPSPSLAPIPMSPIMGGRMMDSDVMNANSFTPQVITGFGGKPAPLQPLQPEI